MVPETNDISKMDQSIEPPKVSSPAALGNNLESVHSLKDQTTTPEERIGNTGKKLIVHEEQKASPKNNDSRTPGTNFTKWENSSSCCSVSGVLEILKQSIDENGVSVCGIANNLKRAPSLDLSVYYTSNCVAQRPHKLSRTQQANAVSLININDESPVASRGCMAFEPGSSNSSNAAHCSSFGSSLGNDYPKMERKFENAGSPIGPPGRDESGVRENMLKEKGCDAPGDTLVTDRKAGAIERESSDDMQGQGLIISKLTEVDPRKEKIENVALTKPIRSRRHSSNKDKRRSPLKKERICKASVLSGHHRNDKLSDNAGEIDDYKELLAAACSVHTANKSACSGPFWKEMERIFAPVASEDLLFLKQQLVDHAEELNQSQSHIICDACDAASFTMKRREVNNLNQRVVKPIAFGRPNTVKKLNVAPSLFRRVLSAVIDEDEGKDLYSQNEARCMSFKCTSHDSCFDSYSHKDCDPNNMDRVESEVVQEEDLQSLKHFPVDRLSSNKSASSNINSIRNIFSTFGNDGQGQTDDGLSYSNAGNYHGNDQRVPILINPSQVISPSISPFNCRYQMLSLDDKLSLELQSIALNPVIMPHLDDGEECIDQEIKGLQRKLYQQVAEVKNNLRKIEKAIQCEQELEKRNVEESAMDQLVEMAYKRMGGQRSKSSRIRKISKQVALAFVKRTLSRCKQYEDLGRSCFSQPSLQDVIFNKPPCEKDVKPTDRNCLAKVSKDVPKKVKRQGLANGPLLDAVQRQDSQSDNLRWGSSVLQQTSSPSSELLSGHGIIFNKWKKEHLNQVIGSASPKVAEVVRITNPGQVYTGFSGAEQPLSRPSGPFSIYDFTFIKEKMKVLGDIASSSSSKANTSRQGGIMDEINMENRDKKGDVVARNSASGSIHKSKAKPQKKRLLSRIGLQEVARSTQMLELKSSDPIANANNKQFPPPANDSQDASRDTRSVKIAQLDALDTPTNDVFNALAGAEDLSSLLDFDEEGLLDHDSAGLEVPMDDLTDVDMFL